MWSAYPVYLNYSRYRPNLHRVTAGSGRRSYMAEKRRFDSLTMYLCYNLSKVKEIYDTNQCINRFAQSMDSSLDASSKYGGELGSYLGNLNT
jgi:hypothetical protein